MAVYVSCAACGWRGCRSMYRDGFAEHVCIRRNDYCANRMDLRDGWPNDRATWERLGADALYAINPELRTAAPTTKAPK